MYVVMRLCDVLAVWCLSKHNVNHAPLFFDVHVFLYSGSLQLYRYFGFKLQNSECDTLITESSRVIALPSIKCGVASRDVYVMNHDLGMARRGYFLEDIQQCCLRSYKKVTVAWVIPYMG